MLSLALPGPGATDTAHRGHGDSIFQAFRLELGAGREEHGDGVVDWDFHGWIGSDEHKLALQSEGERVHGHTEQAEFWALYSRNISTFWDFQIGARRDTQPDARSYAAIGFAGLAPYFLETEAHLFVSEYGDVSARIEMETEFLFTQRLIAEPYLELNFFAEDVPELEVGDGLADAELGVQVRYEISRKFAPYVDLKYERKFGETSSLAQREGEDNDALVATFGIRLLF